MADSKHTPGPWGTHCSHIYAPDGAIIAQVHNPGRTAADYPLVGNRDLMAAAPELLKACQGLLERYLIMGCGEGPEALAAKHAIAKATGEA